MKNLKNGVYILHNEKLFTIEDWKNQSDPTIADFVVLVTDYGAMKISKKVEGKMKWEEAMRFDLPDSTQGSQIIFNRIAIKEAILFIGGEWVDDWFWTSSEYDTSNAWIYLGNTGTMYALDKYLTYCVRSVTAFQLPASDFENEHKSIDNTIVLLELALRIVKIEDEKSMIDKIFDIAELIKDKGESTSLKDIAELENEWYK